MEWPVRLGVRTPGFHPGNRGSIPLRATKKKKNIMANHKSAIKRIKSDKEKMLRNKYQHKSARTAIQKLRETSNKKDAQGLLVYVSSMLDKLAKKNIIHNNKAANLKSKLTKHVNSL